MSVAARGVRLGQLDGLRGVAVVGVVLFHTSVFPGGFLGVDLFFVLSGYVITGGLLRESGRHGAIDLTSFWGRRARRLMPAFLTVVAVALIATAIIGTANVRRFALDDTPWALAQIVNWHFIADNVGYGQVTDVHVFAHLWSISLEWQFYLLWPVAVALLARRAHGERLLAIAAGVGALVSAILMMHWGAIDPTHAYEGTDTRAFALLLGAAAATSPIRRFVLRLSQRTASVAAIVVIAAIAVMWASATGTDDRWLYEGGLLAHSLLAAALVSVLAAWPRVAVSSVLASILPRRLGDWSYSVYLWHWPIVVLLPPSPSAGSPWIYAAVVLGLSTALGAVTTSVVENPFRTGGPWTRGWRGVIILIFAVATVLMIWFALPRPELGAGIVNLDLL